MDKRMNKYVNEDENLVVPKRSDKYKELYKQVYNSYDEFENLVVPSNMKEINLSEIKQEVSSRSEYHKVKEYHDITRSDDNNKVVRKEKIQQQQKEENEIYDIKELLNKAVVSKKGPTLIEPTLTNDDYLKKLKIDSNRTNIEQVKEIYDEIREETSLEDEELLKTANLSLEILSDLKSDNEKTMISPPIKEEELPDSIKTKDSDFYSSTYKFSKKDFEDKKYEENINLLDDEEESEDVSNKSKSFLKIALIFFIISLVVIIIVYLFNYLNKF